MVRESVEFSAALMLAVEGSWPSLDLSSVSLATDGVLKKKKKKKRYVNIYLHFLVN